MYIQAFSDKAMSGLNKRKLLDSFEHNGKKQVERMWDELMDQGYILQFRSRVGRNYEYHYIITSIKYSLEELCLIITEAKSIGFMLYHKNMTKIKDMSTIDVVDYLPISLEMKDDMRKMLNPEEYKKDEGASEVIDNHCNDSSFSESHEETPTVRASQRDISDKLQSLKLQLFRNKNNDNDDIYNTGIEKDEPAVRSNESSALDNLNSIVEMRPDLTGLAKYLYSSTHDASATVDILIEVALDPSLENEQAIITQMNYCETVAKTTGIYNFPAYFLNGLRKIIENATISSDKSAEDELRSLDNKPKIPLFNWLENSESVLV